MLRSLTLCLMMALFLASTLLPARAGQGGSCPSTQAVHDVCYAPGLAAPVQAPAKKPCMTCIVPTAVDLPDARDDQIIAQAAPVDRRASGRIVKPDDRPPRG